LFSIRLKLKTSESSLMDPDHGDFKTKELWHSVFLWVPNSWYLLKLYLQKSLLPLLPLPPFSANHTIIHPKN
jgi:hypothetical protein